MLRSLVGSEMCIRDRFYAESIDKLIKNMNDCSPEIMTAVPRFYQNLYQKINASFSKATGIKKILVQKMLNLGPVSYTHLTLPTKA